MSDNYEQLKEKLVELFQLDQTDLDFGIYRIMNAKHVEISKYLEEDLKPQVKAILGKLDNSRLEELRKQLEEAKKGAKAAGFSAAESPKVKEIEAALKVTLSPAALEQEIFSDLYNFFSRYYEGGDFMSQRRYKKDVYAIPYEGEEVKLHWANSDQYYIKTAEHFNHYRVKLGDGKSVEFRLRDIDVEQNNNKGANRYFVLCSENFIEKTKNETIIYFEYRPVEKSGKEQIKQDDINKASFNKVKRELPHSLLSMVKKTDEKEYTLFEKHLNVWTKKNSFDYFIHKDLGGFLKRELDFFIKNEVLYLDDIIDNSPADLDKRLAKLKALKQVAYKIIAFLTQLEDFQKKLWLKKKFVVETNYCLTLDRVPEEFYKEIAKNNKQREEWVKLFAIDEIKGDLGGRVNYSTPLKVDFLKANPHLVLDTALFAADFKYRLLGEIDNLDEQTDGLLIHSENFQALNLLQEKYKEQVKCVYIDPPYNTNASAILYKNDYKDSAWITLMHNRLLETSPIMQNDGIICVAIDDEEVSPLKIILSGLFLKLIGTAVVRSNPAGRKTKGTLAPSHEFAFFYGKSEKSIPNSLELTEKRLARYPHEDANGRFSWANFIRSGNNDKRHERPKLFYPLIVFGKDKIRVPKMEWNDSSNEYDLLEKPKSHEVVVFPITEKDKNPIEKNWQRGHPRVARELLEGGDTYRVRRVKNKISIDFKTYLDEESLPITWWDKKEYASANYGALEMKNFFGAKEFDFSKSRALVEDCIKVSNALKEESITLDYFAGSGTTGHAVINLNREDEGSRKYILVEMGEYFDTVLKPRIQKVIYSKDWKDGKPVSREGSSHCFKTLRLESYEDALNNLKAKPLNESQRSLLTKEALREEYLLSYMLELETRESLLNIEMFAKPFDYELTITRNQESSRQKIDLVETFNYLMGLYVEKMRLIDNVLMVQGTTRKGERVLALWRDCDKTDNAALNKWFEKNKPNFEYDLLYVNGDNNLNGSNLIEQIFHKKMFA